MFSTQRDISHSALVIPLSTQWIGEKMKRLLLLVVLLLMIGSISAQTSRPTWESVDQRATPAWFSDAKFGIFIHWGTYFRAGVRAGVAGKAGLLRVVLACNDAKGKNNPKANGVQTGTWAFSSESSLAPTTFTRISRPSSRPSCTTPTTGPTSSSAPAPST